MSIQEQPVRYDNPDKTPSSSIVINRGNETYDPFTNDDDENENEQLTDTKHQKQESIRINNGAEIHPVINNTNASSSSDKSRNEQQSRHKSKSPIEHHNNHSDRRSRSPNHRNHYSSDRKRLRPSSPDSSTTTTTVNKTELLNPEIISSAKHKKSHRKKSNHKHRSSSLTKSSLTSNNNSTHHSRRSNSSRNHHSLSSKHSSRDYQSPNDRQTINSNSSRIPSTTITSGTLHNIELNVHETSTEDRNRIYNRLQNVNDVKAPILPTNNSNKISSLGSAFINSNGGSQRSRSNLIQIVTTEVPPASTQVPPVRLSSSPIKNDSTINTNVTSKSIPKTNGSSADDMLMEEMLLEEEQEQSPVKSIDLDSLTIPEISTETIDKKEESPKIITTTTIPSTTTTTTTITTISTITSTPSLTPSPTKKPYTLYKVPHTNHMTPPLSSRHKKQLKKEPPITQSDSTTIPTKPSIDDHSRQTSLDERISNLLSAPTSSSTEQQLDTRPNLPTQTSTPSDKSTESPQDITSLISTMTKKSHDNTTSLTKPLNTNEERRSTTSKHYTSEWLASQKPEEAPTEELTALPSLVTLPTLVSSQLLTLTKPSISNSGEEVMLGKLSEAMSKLIQKQGDTNVPPVIEVEDAVPISAKHLERLERRKQREKRQSEIAAIAKEALKPSFKKHDITKDEYKEIMKKVVTKAMHANEVDRSRISKMIGAYVEKYRTIRQQNTLKPSTTSNGNKS